MRKERSRSRRIRNVSEYPILLGLRELHALEGVASKIVDWELNDEQREQINRIGQKIHNQLEWALRPITYDDLLRAVRSAVAQESGEQTVLILMAIEIVGMVFSGQPVVQWIFERLSGQAETSLPD